MITFISIPIFSSNYVWGIVNQELDEVYLVDPGLSDPVLNAVRANGLSLQGILVTHSHPDHIGGINDILKVIETPVYGPSSSRIPQVTSQVAESDVIELWPGVTADVIAVPGHVPEHLAYYIASQNSPHPALFCGDAVFSSGCGRMFEGTPEEFFASLQKVERLPGNTEVYCAHEYTHSNLNFAEHIEPENRAITQKRVECDQRLKENGLTLPSTIENERETNPFMRCHIDAVKARVHELTGSLPVDEIATFAALRKLKDNF